MTMPRTVWVDHVVNGQRAWWPATGNQRADGRWDVTIVHRGRTYLTTLPDSNVSTSQPIGAR